MLPLRGIFKEESGEYFHFVTVIVKTDSGLCIGPLVTREILLKERRHLIPGFFFVNRKKIFGKLGVEYFT